jgi:hypothetical protein
MEDREQVLRQAGVALPMVGEPVERLLDELVDFVRGRTASLSLEEGDVDTTRIRTTVRSRARSPISCGDSRSSHEWPCGLGSVAPAESAPPSDRQALLTKLRP